MALYGTTDASVNKISYTWTIENPEIFKLDPLLYSGSFESEPDICWQAVLEQCFEGTKKCGLKFLGCAVLGPAFPVVVHWECSVRAPLEKNISIIVDRPLVNRITEIFDSKMDEHRETVSKDSSKLLNQSKLVLCYRITTKKYASFTIPRRLLSVDLPSKARVLTSVEFKFPECPNSLRVHMEVLASRSSVFAAMFNADMMERQKHSVTINDIRIDVFKQLLQFIHTDKAQIINLTVPELLAAADKYDLARLKAACERALFRIVSESTAIEILLIADSYNAQQLRKHTMDFIVANADSVLKDGWETLVKVHPLLLLDVYQAMAKK